MRVEQLFLCPYLSRGNAATYDETLGAICDSTLIVSYLGRHTKTHRLAEVISPTARRCVVYAGADYSAIDCGSMLALSMSLK